MGILNEVFFIYFGSINGENGIRTDCEESVINILIFKNHDLIISAKIPSSDPLSLHCLSEIFSSPSLQTHHILNLTI